jgi:hypothetical protein
MKPNRAKSINVVTKINKATNRWILMAEKESFFTFTFNFIQSALATNIKVQQLRGLTVQCQHHVVVCLDWIRPSPGSCFPNTCNLVLRL